MTATRPGGADQRGRVQDRHVLQRTLPSTPASVRLARMTARVACRAWRIPEAEEPAALVVSELVTTVLAHAGPGGVTLRVRMTPRRLRLEVRDPRGALPDDLVESAAIAVVTATSVRWGVVRRPPGAEMWAEIALDQASR